MNKLSHRFDTLCKLLQEKYPKAEVINLGTEGGSNPVGFLHFSSVGHAISFGKFKDEYVICVHEHFMSDYFKPVDYTVARTKNGCDRNLLSLIDKALKDMIKKFKAFEKEEDDALAEVGMVRDRTTEAVMSEEIQKQL